MAFFDELERGVINMTEAALDHSPTGKYYEPELRQRIELQKQRSLQRQYMDSHRPVEDKKKKSPDPGTALAIALAGAVLQAGCNWLFGDSKDNKGAKKT